MPTTPLTDAERSAKLDIEITRYIALGYRVVTRTPLTAQLVKSKAFSFGWAFFWFLFLFVGLFIYFLWYLGKKDSNVYLTVAEDGALHATVTGDHADSKACASCGRLASQRRFTCKGCGAVLRVALAEGQATTA